VEKNKIKVVIVGGVAVGPKTAARLRRLNPEAEIFFNKPRKEKV
jgi:hypothetical protein